MQQTTPRTPASQPLAGRAKPTHKRVLEATHGVRHTVPWASTRLSCTALASLNTTPSGATNTLVALRSGTAIHSRHQPKGSEREKMRRTREERREERMREAGRSMRAEHRRACPMHLMTSGNPEFKLNSLRKHLPPFRLQPGPRRAGDDRPGGRGVSRTCGSRWSGLREPAVFLVFDAAPRCKSTALRRASSNSRSKPSSSPVRFSLMMSFLSAGEGGSGIDL